MPRLIIRNDQSGATGCEKIIFSDGMSATDIIMREFPDGINTETTQIFINLKRVMPDNETAMLAPLFNNDTVTVINEVKGIELLYYAIAVVVAVGVSMLLAPSIPGNAGQRKESPNNNLFGQTNIARPYQAYPLIFGSPKAYPDLGGEPVVEYINNQKIVKQFMCVGVGLFDVDEVRAGETPLLNFPGASYNIIEPISRVVTVPELTVSFATNEVDGQEIAAANNGDNGVMYGPLVQHPIGSLDYEGAIFRLAVTKDAQSDLLKAAFDSAVGDFIIRLAYEMKINTVAGYGFVPVSGTGDLDQITLVADAINGDYYQLVIAQFTGPKSEVFTGPFYQGPFNVSEKIAGQIGPFNSRVECEQLWFNIIFNRGLKAQVDLQIKINQLDGPSGSIIPATEITENFSYVDNTLDQKFFTHKTVLPLKGYYQFTVRRTNNSANDAAKPDLAQLEAVNCINTYTNATFGNVTVMQVEVPATTNATSLRENRINLTLTSKLISYSGGAVNYTPVASRKMADAVLHMHTDFYGLDPALLALDELYEIQNRLDVINPELAQFDFTFDDLDVSYGERLDAILQVARCFKWLDGDVYRFRRDEAREFESTIISRMDMAQERDYSLTNNPQLLQEYDGIKVEYVDRVTNKKSYVYRTFDPNSADPNSPTIIDAVSSNPRTMELAGCQSLFNAINRAELEMRKLIYQRWTLTDTFLTSGMLLDKGDLVLYAEQYNTPDDFFDGEIVAVNGNIATTSESIIFTDGLTYQVHYTLEDGSVVGPFPVLPVENNCFKFQCDSLASAYVRDSILGYEVQAGSRFVISTYEEFEAARWTVVDKDPSGRNVNITMVNYSDKIYEFDTI